MGKLSKIWTNTGLQQNHFHFSFKMSAHNSLIRIMLKEIAEMRKLPIGTFYRALEDSGSHWFYRHSKRCLPGRRICSKDWRLNSGYRNRHNILHLYWNLIYQHVRLGHQRHSIKHWKTILARSSKMFDLVLTDDTVSDMFEELIEKLYERHGQVVVLIDEQLARCIHD